MAEVEESVASERIRFTREMTDYLKLFKGTEKSFREICVEFALTFPDANIEPSKLRNKLTRMGIKPNCKQGGVHTEIKVIGVVKTGLFKKHKLERVYKCENEIQAEEMFYNDIALNEFPEKSVKIKKVEFIKMLVNN